MVSDLYTRFSKSFSAHADRTFIEAPDRNWTYREIERETGRLAALLQALGVAPGERLLAQTDKSVETLILYFATIRAGAIYLPLNVDYTEAELEYFIGDAEPVLAVCRSQSVDLFERISGKMAVRTLDQLFFTLTDAQAAPVPREPDDVAAILYTSGTTGKPKGAMLTNANLVSNGEVLIDLWRFTAEDRLIHALPIFHVHGLFVAMHCALFSGATMIFLPKFDAGTVIGCMKAGASVLMGVPTFYIRLLGEPDFTCEAASTMRLFVSGSAPLSADIHRAFEQRCGHRVLERYGMTETGMLTSNPYEGERRAGYVGPPLPGVDLRIADFETGKVLAQGEVGIVEVKGPNIFKGYWRNPEKTATEFRPDGYFITGDMGFIDSDGSVQLVGREKDLIITGGLNVYPAEVEALLDDRPDVAEAAVIGVPQPDFGEAVVAIVKPAGPFDPDAVREEMRKDLAAFKVPKAIFVLDDLPRNAMGKIQKKLLRERYADLFVQTNS